jgi:hypothetical protein
MADSTGPGQGGPGPPGPGEMGPGQTHPREPGSGAGTHGGVGSDSSRDSGFADHVLLSALRSPVAATSPLAWRLIGGMIELLASEGADVPLTRFLAPEPGADATFEVIVSGRRQSNDPAPALAPPRPGLTIAAAIREAAKRSLPDQHDVVVVSVAPGGLRRTVLVRSSAGALTFVYPDPGAFQGRPDDCRAALERWQRLATRPTPGSRSALPVPIEEARGTSVREAVAEALSDLTIELDTEFIGAAVRDALADQFPVPATQLPDVTSAGFVAQAAMLAASDHLQIQLESFNDRVRAGSRALESLADELSSRERTATAVSDQLARSVEASVSRLAHRVETRLEEVTRSDVTGTLAGEVRELSDNLRQLMSRIDAMQSVRGRQDSEGSGRTDSSL